MEQLSERLTTLVPHEHLDFIESFEDQIVIGDYAFVHAGIRPGVPLSEQKASDLRWIREEFVDQRGDLEKVVVYGHTIYDEVEERGSRIGIDTGAYASDKLTALALKAANAGICKPDALAIGLCKNSPCSQACLPPPL